MFTFEMDRNAYDGKCTPSISESIGSSVSMADPKETVKYCCRKMVAFMCTQVGVGGMIVVYAVIGAFGFRIIEEPYKDPHLEIIASVSNVTLDELWDITHQINTLDKKLWTARTSSVLLDFQRDVAAAVKDGYTGETESIWKFPAALMFCLSVFTMIGYGNMVPKTKLGKAATMVYAVFGIPLYVLYFKNMGKVLAQTFRWTYTWVYRCSMEDALERGDTSQTKKRVIVPSTACLWVLFAYVAYGTVMFSRWQGWSFMDSAYFCITSLCKIGVGDFAPDNIYVSDGGNRTRLIITFVYLLFGMGVIAMCFDLMREDVTVRVRNLKNDVSLCFEDIRIRAVEFYKRRGSIDSDD